MALNEPFELFRIIHRYQGNCSAIGEDDMHFAVVVLAGVEVLPFQVHLADFKEAQARFPGVKQSVPVVDILVGYPQSRISLPDADELIGGISQGDEEEKCKDKEINFLLIV